MTSETYVYLSGLAVRSLEREGVLEGEEREGEEGGEKSVERM